MKRFTSSLLVSATSLFLLAPTALAVDVNKDFKPENEFELEPWVSLKLGPIDMSINKAVFMLFLAATCAILFFWWASRKMKDRPDGKQTIVEVVYDFCAEQIAKANMPENMLRVWFPYVSALFIFIWFSNMLGYIPLPTNTHHYMDIFGLQIPEFAIYAATANISVPLALAFVSICAYHVEGVRHKGLVTYMKGWVPAGVPSAARAPLFVIEAISHFVRLISLSVRLFANVLAGHLLIMMMLGLTILLQTLVIAPVGLAVGTGFYIFEVVLIASLQAFIFAVLSAIYLGDAVGEGH